MIGGLRQLGQSFVAFLDRLAWRQFPTLEADRIIEASIRARRTAAALKIAAKDLEQAEETRRYAIASLSFVESRVLVAKLAHDRAQAAHDLELADIQAEIEGRPTPSALAKVLRDAHAAGVARSRQLIADGIARVKAQE